MDIYEYQRLSLKYCTNNQTVGIFQSKLQSHLFVLATETHFFRNSSRRKNVRLSPPSRRTREAEFQNENLDLIRNVRR